MPRKTLRGGALALAEQALELLPEKEVSVQGFDYEKLDPTRRKKLEECRDGIIESFRITLESIVRMGQYFCEAKKVLNDRKMYLSWIEAEFAPLGISHDTVNNWRQTYEFWRDSPESRDAMSQLRFRTLYKVCKPSIDSKVRQKIFDMAREGSKPTIEDVKVLQSVARTYHLSKSNITPEAQQMLLTSEVAENPEELKRIAALSKKHQPKVAELLTEGRAETVRAAIHIIKEEKFEADAAEEILEAEVIEESEGEGATELEPVIKKYGGSWLSAIKKVPEESVDLLIVECPFRFDWLDSEDGLSKLSAQAERILVPGGFMLVVMGHKSIMYSAPHLSPLVPLHTVTLRRMPGNSRTIVGINIISASVQCALAYKEPFRHPQRMLVDLQSFGGEETETTTSTMSVAGETPLPGLDVVESGIERGFDQIIRSLICTGETVAHVEISPQNNFKIRESLKTSAIDTGAGAFYSIGG